MSFKPYLNQNYDLIKTQLLKSGKLFEDDKFPANDSSLYRFKNMIGKFSWKRPYEIVKNPEFIVNRIEPNDLDQGQLGDCWVIASAAAVLNFPEYINRIIPENQTFEKNNYAGIFHFRFWLNGEWVDVCVDDRLPVDQNNNLIFCKNNVDKNEMFGPLLEKAYAKLNICYEFLVGGNPKDALIDFTGGINESFDLRRCLPTIDKSKYIDPNKLWELMFKSYNIKSLSSCASNVKQNQTMEQKQDNGLVVGHAYSIIGVYEILSKNGQFNTLRTPTEPIPNTQTLKLLKIRNPWGQNQSYKGSWSTGTKEWNQVSDNIKQILNPNNQSDGQFFMSFQDYIKYFDSMDTVHVDLNGISNQDNTNTAQVNWDLMQFNGSWVAGQNSGGYGDDPKLFWTNPQHLLSLPPVNNKDKISIIISLLQTETAKRRSETNGSFNQSFEALGFVLYSIKPGSKLQNDNKYDKSSLESINRTSTFLYQKEISKRIELAPGNYVIIPCLFEKNKTMKYLLRVYFETNTKKQSNPVPAPAPVPQNDNKQVSITQPGNDPNSKANPKQDIKPAPQPVPVPNSDIKPKPQTDPKQDIKPAPQPVPVPNSDIKPSPQPASVPKPGNTYGELYDKWFYAGMKQADIDNYNKQAELATAKACSIM